MNYYIASSWANMKQVQVLTENLQALGHSVFAYGRDDRNFVPKTELSLEENFSEDQRQALFDQDLEGLRGAQIFILLLPAGNSSHIQAGIAYALGKETILIGEEQKAEIQYSIFTHNFPTIERFLEGKRKEA
ncbi:MAG: hypothetical protein Q8P45_02015 [Candidatus Harrisonbacteria bacterium]|nr:hypothetical protein [Candidatus Harrisonbacteria bacterium]